jgi:hypothetical protein
LILHCVGWLIGPDELRWAAQDEHVRQSVRHIDGIELAIDTDHRCLPGILINDVERAMGAPVVCPVLNEFIGSDMVGAFWPETDAGPVVQPETALLGRFLREL